MASIQKRNKKYAVVYTYDDGKGNKKQKWESYDSYNEARVRKSQIESQQDNKTFIVPNAQTVNEFLDLFIDLYGVKKWSMSTYEKTLRDFDNYVRPILGNIALQDITPLIIEKYYRDLLKTDSAANRILKTKHKVSTGTIKALNKSLKCAFGMAVKWELIAKNPFLNVDPPKHVYKKRDIWTSDMIITALDHCEDPKLAIAIHLSFACSLRLGELLGLRWKDVFISDEYLEKDDAHILVTCELEQVSARALHALDEKDVIFTFPNRIPNKTYKTAMVLKKPKTDSSVRKVWLPRTLALILREWEEEQQKYKEFFGDEYTDYDLVISFEDGRQCSHNVIRKSLKKLTDETGLPAIVFHSFRHSSTTYKLKLNHGDIKATQGDTRHSQADMVMEVYSHILDEDRKVNAQKFDDTFYKNSGNGVDYQKSQSSEVDIDSLVDALKSNPELMSQLVEALK
ncbi:MAG: tyrosine recombinase XerC [Beduini sp.]